MKSSLTLIGFMQRLRGPDLDSAVPAELVAVAGRLNNAFRRLGSGWAIFVEAQRHPAATYPDSVFPDSASALVDAERKADFEEVGAHFESSYFLTFCFLPPAEDAARAETWLYEGRERSGVDAHEMLTGFVDRTDRLLRLFASTETRPASNATATQPSTTATMPSTDLASLGLAPQPATPSAQQRQQAFLDAVPDKRTVSPDRVAAPASPNVLQAGAVISVALITGIRSDLPGQITAQVPVTAGNGGWHKFMRS